MERDRAASVIRALGNTALVFACVGTLVLSWSEWDLSTAVRGLISFGASILFVVFFLESLDSWKRLQRSGPDAPEHHG